MRRDRIERRRGAALLALAAHRPRAAASRAGAVPAARHPISGPGRPSRRRRSSAILEAPGPRARPRLRRRVGIAVREVESGWTTSWNGDTLLSAAERQQILGGADRLRHAPTRGELDLDRRVTIRREDLTLFHQPIAAQIGAERLHHDARQPDLPGDHPERQYLQRRRAAPRRRPRRGARHARPQPASRASASARASGCCRARSPACSGQPSYSVGRGFYAARSAVPAGRRRDGVRALYRRPDGRRDAATGIVDALARLQRGELLSPRLDPAPAVDHVADPDRAAAADAAASRRAGGSPTRPAPARCWAATRPAITISAS